MNKKGVIDSNGVISKFLIPGIIAGVLSAIFHASGAQSNDNYQANADSTRTRFEQGGIQVAGFFIAIVLGALAGIISGLFIKCTNKRVSQ